MVTGQQVIEFCKENQPWFKERFEMYDTMRIHLFVCDNKMIWNEDKSIALEHEYLDTIIINYYDVQSYESFASKVNEVLISIIN